MNPTQFNLVTRVIIRVLMFAGLLLPTLFLLGCRGDSNVASDEFTRLMNRGKSHYDNGDSEKAITDYQKALALDPNHIDVHLNLANAYLLANQSTNAIQEAHQALNLDPGSVAAVYIMGCANLRLGDFDEAIKALQQAKDIAVRQATGADSNINVIGFQLGRAHQSLSHWDDAIREFQEVIDFDPNHPAAHYNLSQALIRAGRKEEADLALEKHRQLAATRSNLAGDIATYERCDYTKARVPFVLEQPARTGVKVTFADMSATAFGSSRTNFHGPIGILDINHRGQNDLLVAEGNEGFRLLLNTNGVFSPQGDMIRRLADANYTECLVGDLDNDRYEDAVLLGDKGIQVLKFATNGAMNDITAFAGLKDVAAVGGALVDLDFAGKLDLLLVPPGSNTVRVLRNLGNMYFKDITQTSGVPSSVTATRQLVVDDWNNDDLMDVFIAREGQPPLLLIKQRGGPLVSSNSPPDWPAGTRIAVGDLNNDLRNDLVIAAGNHLECILSGVKEHTIIPLGAFSPSILNLVDYDNDGWLDITAAGDGLRIWRNLGRAGFREMTEELGLAKVVHGHVTSLRAADFDQDGDTDLLLTLRGEGLQLLRNDGGNANQQLKLRLFGNRSNASGLGVRLDVFAGNWRTSRTVSQLPIEIGVGNHQLIDSVNVHWSDLALNLVEIKVDSRTTLTTMEMIFPTGSCPYLYAWDGKRFRFITDILGASPLGLRLTDDRFIEADTEELVWIGNEDLFKPLDGAYVLQVTEELREVLYLDEAKLVIVDHPPGTEVHPACKLVPRKPWPEKEIWTLQNQTRLRQANQLDGTDVTSLLTENDGQVVSPAKLRVPQLRGLAEPHGLVLDFGPLDVARPLVLALTGWLRFGGGMANVAASHNPDLPFPFPSLEVETGPGAWQPVDVVVGAPAGKTKTILVDLTGKLPPNGRRFRLQTAFEIHWDRIALFDRRETSDTQMTWLGANKSHLHWRGFSEFADLPWSVPLTPIYEKVNPAPNWLITPAGWCTRYGEVGELIGKKDNALALLNGGDELSLSFAAHALPPKRSGYVRDFFFYSVGWDKDSDFHVERGWTVEPLPFHGADDQLYGRQERPVIDGDWWIYKYNTRWVGQLALRLGKR